MRQDKFTEQEREVLAALPVTLSGAKGLVVGRCPLPARFLVLPLKDSE